MQPPDPSSSPTGIIFQRRHQVRPAEPDGRQQAEDDRRDEAEAGADEIRPDVRPEQIEIPMPELEIPEQRSGNAKDDEDGNRAAERSQHQRLGEDVLHEPCPAGAQRETHGELPLARGRAHEHHSRDVQADDEQDHAREAKQHRLNNRYLPPRARAHRVIRLDAGGGLVLVRRRVLTGESGHDGRRTCLSSREARAWRQAADHLEPFGLSIELEVVRRRQARMQIERHPKPNVRRILRTDVPTKVFRRDAHHDMCGLDST